MAKIGNIKKSRSVRRARRHRRIRKKLRGTADRPRLVIFRSLKNIDPDVKVLLTTGFERPILEAQKICADHNTVSFVSKPYRLDNLSEAIRHSIRGQSS